MLAHKPPAFVESVLSGPLKRFTSKTIVSQAALEEGVRCLAVSIFNRRRQCVGTLSVSARRPV